MWKWLLVLLCVFALWLEAIAQPSPPPPPIKRRAEVRTKGAYTPFRSTPVRVLRNPYNIQSVVPAPNRTNLVLSWEHSFEADSEDARYAAAGYALVFTVEKSGDIGDWNRFAAVTNWPYAAQTNYSVRIPYADGFRGFFHVGAEWFWPGGVP